MMFLSLAYLIPEGPLNCEVVQQPKRYANRDV